MPSTSEFDIICLSSYHGRGGAQNNAARLIRGFEARGYKCSLVFLKEREPHAIFDGVSHIQTLTGPKRGRFTLVQAAWKFHKLVQQAKPLAIFGFFPITNVIGALAASQIKKCSFVGSLRNPSDQQNPFVSPLERWTGNSKMTTATIAVSQTVAKSFSHYPTAYKNKVRVVYNATPKLPYIDEEKAVCRQELRLPQKKPIFGTLSRLHKQKNIQHAILSFAKLPSSDAILVIAGEGPEEEALRALAQDLNVADRILFLGPVSGVNVTRFYRAIDVFLFPSIYEGFGLTLVEAMSQGCPVLASDLDICREIGREAALLCALDQSQWAHHMDMLLTHPEIRNDLANKGLLQAAYYSDEDSMVESYLSAAGLPLVAQHTVATK